MNSGKNLDSGYVKSYYDGFLSKYEKEYAFYRWQAGEVEKIHFYQTRRALVPFLNKLKGSILEIGGGDAIWTMEYISHVNELNFLDISEEMVSRAKKRLNDFSLKINFINNDFVQNDFSGNTFDGIVSIRNLEYFTDKNFFIEKVNKLLKEDGQFVLVTKSPKYHMSDKAKQKTLHTAQIDILELIKMINSSGLRVLEVRPAICGKLFRFSFMRFISNLLHKITLILPWKILPLNLLSRLSESFVIYAKK